VDVVAVEKEAVNAAVKVVVPTVKAGRSRAARNRHVLIERPQSCDQSTQVPVPYSSAEESMSHPF
jgi:hypothetical protein